MISLGFVAPQGHSHRNGQDQTFVSQCGNQRFPRFLTARLGRGGLRSPLLTVAWKTPDRWGPGDYVADSIPDSCFAPAR